jgi:hypothetical protein
MSFMSLYRNKACEADTIDDFIDQWHDGAGEGMPLYEYLGMTLEEYAAWVERNELPE